MSSCSHTLRHIFHFVSSYKTIVPVTKRALSDIGFLDVPKALWEVSSPPSWLLDGELYLMVIGFLASIAICLRLTKTARERFPWCALAVILFCCGVWILFQPMQMRGMIG